MLSGYNSDLYNDLLNDWSKVEIKPMQSKEKKE